MIGTFFARLGRGENAVINALYKAVLAATVLSAIGFIPITMAFDNGKYGFGDLYISSIIGLVVTFLLVAITEYYTGTRWNPVKAIAKASQTGHATNIIEGLAIGMQATAAPVIVIVAGILVAHHFAGLYGIGVAVMAQLSMTGLIVALDAYGPVTDNAGGIAEMADLPEEVRGVTDPLDAVGNTTKAVTKGYAIGSAALAALILFDSYTTGLSDGGLTTTFSLSDPWVVTGLFLGGLMPFLFASLAMQAVGRVGGQVVEEVRRQFREHPGIMEGTEKPDYSRAVGIVTGSAIKSMLAPALIPIGFPIVVGIINAQDARRPADRHDRHRPLPRDRDDLGRRRLGQREEVDRGRRLRRQGLGGARRVGHRRHRRRPVQGHGRPRDQPDDQDREHRRDPDHPADRLDPRLDASARRPGTPGLRARFVSCIARCGARRVVCRAGAATGLVYALKPIAPVLSLGVLYTPAVLVAAVLFGAVYAIAVAVASMLVVQLPVPAAGAHADARRRAQLDCARRVRDHRGRLQQPGDAAHADARPKRSSASARRRCSPTRRRRCCARSRSTRFASAPTQRARRRSSSRMRASRRASQSLLALAEERQHAEAIRRSDALKTVILQAVSHDFRTPIATIRAAVDGLAGSRARADADDRADLLDTIALEVTRLTRLVESVLDLSRLEAGAAAPRTELWEVDDLLAQAVSDVASRRTASTSTDMRRAAACCRRRGADPARARQPSRQRTQVLGRRRRRAARAEPTGVVLVEVLDRGGATRRASGLGLGLAIARGFAEANGATLELLPRERRRHARATRAAGQPVPAGRS